MKVNYPLLILGSLVCLPAMIIAGLAINQAKSEQVSVLPTVTYAPSLDNLYPYWSFGDFIGNYSIAEKDVSSYLVSLGLLKEEVRTQYGEIRIEISTDTGVKLPFVIAVYSFDTEHAPVPLYWSRSLYPVNKLCALISIPENETVLPQLYLLPAGETSVERAMGFNNTPETSTLKEGHYTSITGDKYHSLLRCIVSDRPLGEFQLVIARNSLPTHLFGISYLSQ
jgi:hypothetical protein